MRYMPKPGQTAPQMPPRGPKVPINKSRPLNATGTPVGRPKSINAGPMTPPPSTNVNPVRPGMTGGTRPSMPATNTNRGRRLTGGAPPSSANVNPIRPGMRGAGATQSGREQAMQGAAATMNTFKDYKDAQAGRVGAGAQKAFGAKKGGKVSSKMGAVKTSAKPDGIAKKGKTKGRMV